ncbi:peptide deformylase [Neosynechococcus sphagnicola sy1]|uniref:Peptide deformylase n=1 Tax=Neosynechococcus sphagnicola sy1 TaxID=1497020 RepID=A0A098TJE2_9CYAN|nr:peptide deformylase [Neosynechococcus sphagnicola]KGF72231.1 peptide deformylase [Neosynechococcus sphagnicola sy1]
MATLLQVAQLGNSILRQTAQAIAIGGSETIAPVDAAQLETLIEDMLATLQESKGVGLAAPQVSASLRLLIVASHPNARYPQAPWMEPTVMINPRILAHSQETLTDWEGCLSIPGIRGLVPRYREVEVEYTDLEGKCQKPVLTDFVARIFQHEFDHLEGIVFLDRVESTQDLMTEQEYQQRVVAVSRNC